MEKSALIVVDVQKGIFNGKKKLYQPEKMLNKINLLEDKTRKTQNLIVYIQHEGATILKKGEDDWLLHSKLNPTDIDIFIEKKEPNSFLDTGLDSILKDNGVKQVVICGLISSICVKKTSLGALELGYKTILASDAHSNLSKNPEQTIKKVHRELLKAGVELIETENIQF